MVIEHRNAVRIKRGMDWSVFVQKGVIGILGVTAGEKFPHIRMTMRPQKQGNNLMMKYALYSAYAWSDNAYA